METFAKIMVLTLVGVFGSAGAVIYFSDTVVAPSPEVRENVNWNLDKYEKVDVQAYRKQILENYKTEKRISKSASSDERGQSIWSNTFDDGEPSDYAPSKEAVALAERHSLKALEGKVNYWYGLYRSLQSEGKSEARNAYMQYKNYRAALEFKRDSE